MKDKSVSSGMPGTEMLFDAPNARLGQSTTLEESPKHDETPMGKRAEIPPPILDMDPELKDQFMLWIDQWILDLENAQSDLQDDWFWYEKAYRALPGSEAQFLPFEGASEDIVPVGQMVVNPIHARLDVGIFKQDPVFTFTPLRVDIKDSLPGVQRFVQFYQRHKLKLRSVAAQRLLELVKLGTMVFKVVYDRDESDVLRYTDDFQGTEMVKESRFVGPRLFGVHLGDFLFPPFYENIQDCPIVVERQRTTYEKLKLLEAAGKLADVDKVKYQQTIGERTQVELAREDSSRHALRTFYENELDVYEGWCDFIVEKGKPPAHLVFTYHKDTRTFLQLRLNWYHHQRKPYVLIPFKVTNDTMYGLGIMEIIKPLQDAITKWQRMASDNAYIANIRMFIVRRDSNIEEVPRLYAGRCFYVEEPTKDFIPFAAGDIYPSTLAERQNLFAIVEKVSGVNDYLSGRESPIIGTRATATSTLALMREALAGVEAVLENIRQGFNEIMEFMISLWIQYGTGDILDVVYGSDDPTAQQVKQFFSIINQDNLNGAFGLDLSVTDASNNKQALQQMQLQMIEIMMQYLEKVLQAGAGALQAIQQNVPQYAAMVGDVMDVARKMFKDFLEKFDVPDPEEYLPDLKRYLGGQVSPNPTGAGGGGDGQGRAGGPGGELGVSAGNGPARPAPLATPAKPGSGGESYVRRALAGAGSGTR